MVQTSHIIEMGMSPFLSFLPQTLASILFIFNLLISNIKPPPAIIYLYNRYMYHTLIDDDAHLRNGSIQHMGGM